MPHAIPAWHAAVPPPHKLNRSSFGRPSSKYSFTTEACFETIIFNVLLSGYFDFESTAHLCASHPLVHHLVKMIPILTRYDFRWLREYDSTWATQTDIQQHRELAFLALVFHYKLHLPSVVRYLGEKYTGAYRDVSSVCSTLRTHNIDEDLITHYQRIMTEGCPAHFNASSSRDNVLLYLREGNDKSINQHREAVLANMAKEARNNFAFNLPGWMARFLPHIFTTPQSILYRNGKTRQISDHSRRHHPDSVPINHMTSTPSGVELDCLYGTVYDEVFSRLWNLRLSYPTQDIIIHANDVKSCFRQLKNAPDIVGAFSYILYQHLWVQIGLTFGADFSPASWEALRRILEQLAQSLFDDDSLRDKHRAHLDKLLWCDSLNSKKTKSQRNEPFTKATPDSFNTGVLDDDGRPVNTPHHYFVDDGVYVEVYDVERIERALAASIEAIFILLGHSDLDKRQDPVSFDKIEELPISPQNKVLGLLINTRRLTAGPPPEFITRTISKLSAYHSNRRSFVVKEMSELTGLLNHIATTCPWLAHLMSHLYSSLAAALQLNKSHLISTRKQFRDALKLSQSSSAPASHRTFAQAAAAKQVHSSRQRHFLNKTCKEELRLITLALADASIPKASPIAHLVLRDPSAEVYGDSCLYAAGGYSIRLKFWWYFEWPADIRQHTVKFIHNNKAGKLISINALEYATVIINFAACTLAFQQHPLEDDPYPVVHILADNVAAEEWTRKGCKRSLIGRALGRLQCALMLRNPVGLTAGRVTTKDNFIADEISRVKSETDSLTSFAHLSSLFPQLRGCRRFHPSQELLSAITDALLHQTIADPLELNTKLLNAAGSFTS